MRQSPKLLIRSKIVFFLFCNIFKGKVDPFQPISMDINENKFLNSIYKKMFKNDILNLSVDSNFSIKYI